MKKIITILIAGAIVCVSSSCAKYPKMKSTREGDRLLITRGDNYVEFEKIKYVDESYRVFGMTMFPKGNNCFNHLVTAIPILPLERVRQLWKRDNCEKEAAREAAYLSIIILDPEIEKKFHSYMSKRYEHFSLRLTGTLLRKQKHLFRGEPVSIGGGSFNFDQSLLLDAVAIVEWEEN